MACEPALLVGAMEELRKLSVELRRLESDLYLTWESRSRVEVPKEEELEPDPDRERFGDI